MCWDPFSEEVPCGSILVNDHLLLASTKSLHFGWSFMGGSTVVLKALTVGLVLYTFLFFNS